RLGPGAEARVIAGELAGVRGPAHTFTPVNVFDLKLEAGAEAELPLPVGQNAALVLLRGGVRIEGTEMKGEAQMALLTPGGDAVRLAAEADSVLLVLSGEPIREPVESYVPFVMNTREELRQA